MLEEECGQYCAHHGFRKIFHCALYNAYKLKRWLIENNSGNNDTPSVSQPTSCSSPENYQLSDDDYDGDDEEYKSSKTGCSENYSVSSINDDSDLSRSIKFRADNILETKDLSSVKQTIKKEEIIQIIPGSSHSSLRKKNELLRNSSSIAPYRCKTCGCLSRRQSPEGVDEVDGYRR